MRRRIRMSAAVEWTAEGGLLSEFLNQLQAADISLKRVRPHGDCLVGIVSAVDYRRVRPAARRTGTRVRIRRKRGVAFRLYRLRKRIGLVIGAVGAIALLLFFSTRIWAIVPSGLEQAETERALAVVADMGVAIGHPIHTLKPKEISIRALSQLNSVIALTINMDGCIAHVDMVADNTNHPLSQDITLSDLVATRDGLIVQTEIWQGTRLVKVGEGVTAGTLLASGATETTAGPLLGRAEGVVIARTERTLSVEVPLKQQHWQATGAPFTQTTLSLFSLPIPLSAQVALPSAYTQTVDRDFLTLDGLPLPLGICRRQITPLLPITVLYKPAEAEKMAAEQLAQQEQEMLGEAVIEDKTVSGKLVDGVYRVTAHYVCLENIAREVPVTVVKP